MTQDSAFHNGYQFGDSRYYTALDFHSVMSQLHLGQGGYIVPEGSTSILQVTFSAGQDVSVAAGTAFVAGVYYNNSAPLVVSLEDNSTIYNRIDLVIIKVDWTNQTARIVSKRGVAESAPSIPSLQQEIGNIFEIPLATVFIPPSFAGFGDEYIYDTRDYLLTPDQDFGIKNIMFNSEFMTPESPTQVPNIPYPMWYSADATADHVNSDGATKFDLQSRGRALEVLVSPGKDLYTTLWANNGTTKRITLAFIVHVTSSFGTTTLDFSIDGGVTTLYKIPVTAEPIVIIARTLVGASGGNQALQPHFSSVSTTNFKLGQMTVAFGNTPAPFLPQKEFVLQPYRLQVVQSATGDSGTERKVYSQDDLWPGVQNAFMMLKSGDTNAAADSIYTSVIGNITGADVNVLRAETGRLPINTVRAYRHGMVGLDLQYPTTDIGSALYFWAQYMFIQKNAIPDWVLYLVGIHT